MQPFHLTRKEGLSRLSRVSEFFVFEFSSTDEPYERVTKQKVILKIVKAPSHFVEAGLQVLRRDSMPCTPNPALEKREGSLHSVSFTGVAKNTTARNCAPFPKQ